MSLIEENRRKMVKVLAALSAGEGMHRTLIDGVKFVRADRSHPRMPMLYEPSIVVLVSGRKEGYVGDQVFTLDADHYLVVSVPLAFELVSTVTHGEPLLGVSIRVEMSTLGELCTKMNLSGEAYAANQKSAQATPMEPSIAQATLRLLECLLSPEEATILGQATVRELVYRVLQGEQGEGLCAFVGSGCQLARINAVLQRLNSTFMNPIDVSGMAREAGMSISAFHHTFKAVTATSPVQYVKALRLHKARMLILHEGMGSAAAAESVGYESSSQFSREFKRRFGTSPKRQIEASRGNEYVSLGSVMVA